MLTLCLKSVTQQLHYPTLKILHALTYSVFHESVNLVPFPILGEAVSVWRGRVLWDTVGEPAVSHSNHTVSGARLLWRRLHLQIHRQVPSRILQVAFNLLVYEYMHRGTHDSTRTKIHVRFKRTRVCELTSSSVSRTLHQPDPPL